MTHRYYELSPDQFIKALIEFSAVDINGINRYFYNNEIRDVIVKDTISIIGAHFTKNIKVKNCTFDHFSIFDSTFEGYFFLETCEIENFGITNCNIKHLSTFHSKISWFSIFELKTIETLEIANPSGDDIFLDRINTEKDVWINSGSINTNIHIKDCLITGNLSILVTEIKNSLVVEGSTVKGNTNIGHLKSLPQFILSNSTFGIVEFINLTILKFIKVKDCSVNYLHIKENVIAPILGISKSKVCDIRLNSIADNMILSLAELELNKLSMGDEFHNLGYMKWNKLTALPDSEIVLQNAIMGKWDIVNCNFSDGRLFIYSSKITDAFYTNTKFPNNLSFSTKIEIAESPQDILRDGYNQLKTIAQKQNDRKTFLHYQAAELHSYYETLGWNKKDLATKLQLWAQKWSSDFGTKWTWGVLFVLAFNFVFVSVSSLDKIWQPNWPGITNYLTGYFASLFSLISVPKYFQTDWEIIWFYISRIFIAFGIYQTIAAFRKFGKSE